MMNLLPWFAAILLSALAPALVGSIHFGSVRVLPIAYTLALLHSTLLGLPVALACQRKQRTSITAALVAGFVVGALPTGCMAWPLDLSFSSSASIDGVPTLVNGIPTLVGWGRYITVCAASGGLGALGGVIFWLVLTSTGALRGSQAGTPGHAGRSRVVGACLAFTASAAAVAVAAIPSITADRSCHNMFSDGRRSISPKSQIDLDIDVEEWPRLVELFASLENTHQMNVRNSSSEKKDAVNVLSLSACLQDGVVISVNQQLWASHIGVPRVPEKGLRIALYEVTALSQSNQLGQDLLALLNAEWPGKAKLRTVRPER